MSSSGQRGATPWNPFSLLREGPAGTKSIERCSRTKYDRRRHGLQRGRSPKTRSASSFSDVMGTYRSVNTPLAGIFGSRWERVGDSLRAVWGFGLRSRYAQRPSRGTTRGCARHVTQDVRGSDGAATALPAAPRTNDSVRRNGLSAQGVSAQHFEGFVLRRARSASSASTSQSRSVANSPTATTIFRRSSDLAGAADETHRQTVRGAHLVRMCTQCSPA